MNPETAVAALAALAQPTRLALFRLLVERGPGPVPAGEIAEALGVPTTTLSFHLKALTRADLIAMEPEGRFVRYRARFPTMQALVAYLTENCCRGEPGACTEWLKTPPDATSLLPEEATAGQRHPLHVLVLCTGNSARSILAEALFNHLGHGRVKAWSAGSHPAGAVNPHALALLQQEGLGTARLRSKSWEEFSVGPEFDYIITVCDNAAGESCPVWPGHPMTVHWGIADPAAAAGGAAARQEAFRLAYDRLQRRIQLFLALPLEQLSRAQQLRALAALHAAADEDRP